MKISSLFVVSMLATVFISGNFIPGNAAEDENPITSVRKWTSASGTEIEGTLYYFRGSEVAILDNGNKPYLLSVSQLSQEDSQFLTKWSTGSSNHWRYVRGDEKRVQDKKALAVLPAKNKPVRVDVKGNLKEPYFVLYAVITNEPKVVRDASEWKVSHSFTAQTKDGKFTQTTTVSIPIKALSGQVSLSRILSEPGNTVGDMTLNPGNAKLTVSGGGKGVSVIGDVEIDVIVER